MLYLKKMIVSAFSAILIGNLMALQALAFLFIMLALGHELFGLEYVINFIDDSFTYSIWLVENSRPTILLISSLMFIMSGILSHFFYRLFRCKNDD